jgi:hypothetical protein
MAYDEKTAERVRELLSSRPDVVERKMMGGLRLMVGRTHVLLGQRTRGPHGSGESQWPGCGAARAARSPIEMAGRTMP